MDAEWCEIIGFVMRNEDVVAPWLMVLESVGDSTHLKFEAEGQWRMEASVVPGCGPDGLPGFTLPSDQLIVTRCRYGALIGKLGGSSAAHYIPAQAGISLAADEPFAIGAMCLQKVPDGVRGPLFISFNALWRPIGVKAMKLRIFGTRIAEAAGKSPATT
jgi:hypothetical protein